jgi:predicted alpha/beta-hydrolase family hydrolase
MPRAVRVLARGTIEYMTRHSRSDKEFLEVPEAHMRVSVRFDGAIGQTPLIVFGHGAGAGIDHALLEGIALALVDEGLSVLRYQFPFMERRGGSGFGRDAPAVALATVAAAAELGVTRAAGMPVFVGGHSYGGRMTTLAAAAGRLSKVAGLVLLSFPLHGAKRPARDRGLHLPQIDLPMLFVSGARDAMAEAPLLEEIVGACPMATCVRIDGADHGWKAARRRWPAGPLGAVAREVRHFVDAQG